MEKEVKFSDEVNEVDGTEAKVETTEIVENTTPTALIEPVAIEETAPETQKAKERGNSIDDLPFQKLEEKAKKAEEAHAAEEKLRKELEVLNSKLLAEKTALLDSLAGEKGSLQEFQEKTAKLQAQKNDLDNQLRVSISLKVLWMISEFVEFHWHSRHQEWRKIVNRIVVGYFICKIMKFEATSIVIWWLNASPH